MADDNGGDAEIIYTTEEVINDQEYSCYETMGWILSTHACHYFVILLVLLDVAFVCTEMVFDRKIRSYNDCCQNQNYLYFWNLGLLIRDYS